MMDKTEFKKKWQELLNKDCNKTNPTALSRTLTDSEADKIGEHLWEWFEQAKIPFTALRLAEVMIRTMGKHDSCQDWAEDIVRKIEKGGAR